MRRLQVERTLILAWHVVGGLALVRPWAPPAAVVDATTRLTTASAGPRPATNRTSSGVGRLRPAREATVVLGAVATVQETAVGTTRGDAVDTRAALLDAVVSREDTEGTPEEVVEGVVSWEEEDHREEPLAQPCSRRESPLVFPRCPLRPFSC